VEVSNVLRLVERTVTYNDDSTFKSEWESMYAMDDKEEGWMKM